MAIYRQQEHKELVAKIDKLSRPWSWPNCVAMAEREKDASQMRKVFASKLTTVLAGTSLRNICIPFMPLEEVLRVVEDSEITDLNEWHTGVQQGIQYRDWNRLIAHRTYNFALRDLLLR